MTRQIIPHDVELEDYEFDGIAGGLLFCVDDATAYNDDTGEATFIAVYSVEVVGFHLGSNVCLTRDQMIQMQSKAEIDFIETVQLEKRKEAIG